MTIKELKEKLLGLDDNQEVGVVILGTNGKTIIYSPDEVFIGHYGDLPVILCKLSIAESKLIDNLKY